MESVLLVIRQAGKPDIVETFSSRAKARARLIAFVRSQPARDGGLHAQNDDVAIAAWFKPAGAFYAITWLEPVKD